ncbi:hypothetical protein MHN79_03795, partial [Vibrio sp. Of14-4]|uniref:hypothetical protein n=1 Tax=Vibrio sp. Of14-4 TaxID=2724878 RepID=UPI001EF3B7B9
SIDKTRLSTQQNKPFFILKPDSNLINCADTQQGRVEMASKFLEEIRQHMRMRGYSLKTEKAYL